MGIRGFQPGYSGTSSTSPPPATGGTSSVAGQARVMFAAGTPRFRHRPGSHPPPAAPAGPGALAGGLTEASALDIIDTLMSPQVNHNLTTDGRRDADHCEYWLSSVPASGSETDTTCQIG